MTAPAAKARASKRRLAPDTRPYLPEDALLRRVQRERTVALSGGRALFMQAAHPVAFIGFFTSTKALEDPFPRLARTALAVNTVIHGTAQQAAEVQQIVGAMHGRVRGRLTENVGRFRASTPFRGDDPELLLWILAAFIDSSYQAFEQYVRPLDEVERERLWCQWRQVGEIFGLDGATMPASYAEFVDYVDAMLTSGDLVVSPLARRVSRQVILNPPIPAALAPIKELVNQLTVNALPGDLREQFGFHALPGRGLAAGAFQRWMRLIGTPLAPDAVRHIPDEALPKPDWAYADLIAFANARFGRPGAAAA